MNDNKLNINVIDTNATTTQYSPSVSYFDRQKTRPTSASVPSIGESSNNNNDEYIRRYSLSVSVSNNNNDNTLSSSTARYMKVKPLHVEETFPGMPITSSPSFTSTRVYKIFGISSIFFSCLLGIVYIPIEPAYAGLILLIPGLIVLKLEAAFVDKWLIKKLLSTFTWWFLFGCIIVHAVAISIHNAYKEPNQSYRESLLWRSTPVTLVGYTVMISFDAYIYRRAKSIKRILLILGLLNSIRYFIERRVQAEQEDIRFCWIYCSNAESLASASMLILMLFTIRMVLRSINSPGKCFILDARLSFKLDIVKNHVKDAENPQHEFELGTLSAIDNFHDDDNDIVDALRRRETINGKMQPRVYASQQLSLIASDDPIYIRCEPQDTLLNLEIMRKIGHSKWYIWWNCMFWPFVIIISTINLNVPTYAIALLHAQLIVFVLVELSSRVNGNLIRQIVKTFEFWYLEFWFCVWSISVMFRNLLEPQVYYTKKSIFFIAPIIVFVHTWILMFDAYFTHSGLFLKRLWLSLALTNAILQLVYIHFNPHPPNQYDFCHLWCTNTGEVQNAALVNTILFCGKYLWLSIYRPSDFLLLRSFLKVMVTAHSKHKLRTMSSTKSLSHATTI